MDLPEPIPLRPHGLRVLLGGAPRSALSREEFGRLYTQHGRALWCIAAAVLGSADGADDVLQEAAALALTKLADFDRRTSFPAWMGQFVRYTALNEGRKLQRRRTNELPAEGLQGRSASHDSMGSATQLFDGRLLAALAELSETARACLLLKTVLELEYTEIAAALEIPEGTAMSHVHRAREQLRERLRPHLDDVGGRS